MTTRWSGAENLVANIRLAGESIDIGTVFDTLQRVASNAGQVGMARRTPLEIKVVRTANGARIRVKGPEAEKYKQMILKQIEDRKDALTQQIKDDIVARSRL